MIRYGVILVALIAAGPGCAAARAQAAMYTGSLTCEGEAKGAFLLKENGFRLSYQFSGAALTGGIVKAIEEHGRGDVKGLNYALRGSGHIDGARVSSTLSGTRNGPEISLTMEQKFTLSGVQQPLRRHCQGKIRRR